MTKETLVRQIEEMYNEVEKKIAIAPSLDTLAERDSRLHDELFKKCINQESVEDWRDAYNAFWDNHHELNNLTVFLTIGYTMLEDYKELLTLVKDLD